ncbi:MAG: hypothetical protein O2871_02210 [bacterium]|nr:hypothetical protein [bacterium]
MSTIKTYFITIFIALSIVFSFLFFKTDVFNAPVISIVNAAPSCSCDCTYNQQTNRQESKYCGKVGSTGEYTSSGGTCYTVDWHCNAEADSSGSCVTKNHLYKDKGAQVDNSYCSSNPDPTDPPDPSNPSGSVYVSSRNGSSATVCNTFNRSVSIGVNRCQKNYDEPQVCSEVKYAAVCAPVSEDIGAGSPSTPNCKGVNVGIPACGVWQLDIDYNGSSLYGESGCYFDNCAPPITYPGSPTPAGVCSANNDKITYTWGAVANANYYSVRFNAHPRDNWASNWQNICNAGQAGLDGDYCFDTTGTSVTFNAPVNQLNDFWIHSRVNSDPDYWSDPANIDGKACNVQIPPSVTCKSLTGKVIGTGDFIGQTPLLTGLPNDFTGVVTLSCTSESKPKPVNKMEFTFAKDTIEQKKIVNTNIDCSENAGVFTCSGKATFDVTGSASYSAKAKVCIVDGVNEICSP